MTKKTKERTYPAAPAAQPRQMVPPARLPEDIVKRAYKIMNTKPMTPTEFIEKAWTDLVTKIEAEDARPCENCGEPMGQHVGPHKFCKNPPHPKKEGKRKNK